MEGAEDRDSDVCAVVSEHRHEETQDVVTRSLLSENWREGKDTAGKGCFSVRSEENSLLLT